MKQFSMCSLCVFVLFTLTSVSWRSFTISLCFARIVLLPLWIPQSPMCVCVWFTLLSGNDPTCICILRHWIYIVGVWWRKRQKAQRPLCNPKSCMYLSFGIKSLWDRVFKTVCVHNLKILVSQSRWTPSIIYSGLFCTYCLRKHHLLFFRQNPWMSPPLS